jgi:hypothetical protein
VVAEPIALGVQLAGADGDADVVEGRQMEKVEGGW